MKNLREKLPKNFDRDFYKKSGLRNKFNILSILIPVVGVAIFTFTLLNKGQTGLTTQEIEYVESIMDIDDSNYIDDEYLF